MISYYFGSKERLLESLLFYRTSDLKSQLDHLILEEIAPIDKINKLIELYISRINKNKGIYRIIHFEFNSDKRAKSLSAFAELKKGNLKTFETIIEEGQKQTVERLNALDTYDFDHTVFKSSFSKFFKISPISFA